MHISHFLTMSTLSLEKRNFIVNCIFENKKSLIMVKHKYYAKFKGIYHSSKLSTSKLLSENAKAFKKVVTIFYLKLYFFCLVKKRPELKIKERKKITENPKF